MTRIPESRHVSELSEINRRLTNAQPLRAGLQNRLRSVNRTVFVAGLIYAYRRLQMAIRSPAKSYNLWPLGLMLVVPFAAGSLTFAFGQIAFGSLGAAFLGFIFVAGVTAAFMACLLFFPNNAHLEQLVCDARNELQNAQSQADIIRSELSNVQRAMGKDIESRDAILRSVQYKRELLLQQDWRSMRGGEWESFLGDAFLLLGATIEPTGRSGDQGVDLIVNLGPRRYAVQAKGYDNSVGNAAVQQAVAGMAHYGCNCSAVITNSRFTAGAIALAESNRCVLIGEDQIPAFVLGKLPL